MDPLRLLTGVRKTDLQGTLSGLNQTTGRSWATMDKVESAIDVGTSAAETVADAAVAAADAHAAAMERIASAAEWAVFALAMYLAFKMWSDD